MKYALILFLLCGISHAESDQSYKDELRTQYPQCAAVSNEGIDRCVSNVLSLPASPKSARVNRYKTPRVLTPEEQYNKEVRAYNRRLQFANFAQALSRAGASYATQQQNIIMNEYHIQINTN